MTSDRNKPGVAFWATVVVVVALVAYPLSFGPWFWADSAGRLPTSLLSLNRVYDPLRWIVERSPTPVQNAFGAYLSLWLPDDSMEYRGP